MSRGHHHPTTVGECLAQRAHATPEAAGFLQQDGDAWSAIGWADFAERVAILRRGLAAAGLHRGHRLALIAPVSLEWELLHHAAMGMGVAIVGLDAHDLPSRIATMAAQAEIHAFAVQSPAVMSGLLPRQLSELHLLIKLGDSTAQWPHAAQTLCLAELMRLGEGVQIQPAPAMADDIATVIFTSGTTGAPKGIAYSHRQLCMAMQAISEAFNFVGTGGRLLCWLPLSNLFQRMVNLAGMHNGASTWLLGDPRRVMEVVASVSPDVFVAVPRFFEKLHDGLMQNIATLPAPARLVARGAWHVGRQISRRRQAGQKVPLMWKLLHQAGDAIVLRRVRQVMGARLRCMVSGSAPMPLWLLQDFDALGWIVLEAYGLSENVLPMAMNRLDAYQFGSVGRPLAGNDLQLDPDGMVHVRGAGVFSGYVGEPAQPHGDGQTYYATGDLGQLDAQGYLRLTGRQSDIIKTSTGRRVAPAGVEAVLRSVPGIDQAVVLGAGRKVLLALCTRATANADAPAVDPLPGLLAQAIQQLNPHERPAGITLLAAPFSIDHGELTPNLKLRRIAIEDRHAAALSALERQVRAQRGDEHLVVQVEPTA